MAKVTLTADTIETITEYVETYTKASGEEINGDLIRMTIDLLVQRYVSLKSFPSSYSVDAIKMDVEKYFSEHSAQIAFKIPEITIGRFGTEGELSHTENGVTRVYGASDPLRLAFPDVVQMAKVL